MRPVVEIENLIERAKTDPRLNQLEVLTTIESQGCKYPIVAVNFGRPMGSPAPLLILTGGVHGLERIGAQICFSFINSVIERMTWDEVLLQILEKIRIVIVPLVNPVGYHRFSRSNANGVDLMRNAPIEAEGKVPLLIGGHRFSPRLPYFRGRAGELEIETAALIAKLLEELKSSSTAISLDFHSGFGLRDRLWFPYAKSKQPFFHLPELEALMQIFAHTYPYHVYRIEPQSQVYMTHGDLWDYLYDLHRARNGAPYLPLALEIGSWSWVKKNPIQLFSRVGMFNPIKPHRHARALRRHHLLLDFLLRAITSSGQWATIDEQQRERNYDRALERWYGQ